MSIPHLHPHAQTREYTAARDVGPIPLDDVERLPVKEEAE